MYLQYLGINRSPGTFLRLWGVLGVSWGSLGGPLGSLGRPSVSLGGLLGGNLVFYGVFGAVDAKTSSPSAPKAQNLEP